MPVDACITPDWRVPAGVHALSTTRAAGDMADPAQAPPGLPAPPRWLRQVHGIAVADLDAAPSGIPVADASFTTSPGVVCVVRTADCLPVLFAARDGSAVAAAHAGWRGLAAGVLEATVTALRARCGDRLPLQAWLGPCIGQRHFEVGPEVRTAFIASDAGASGAFAGTAQADRWLCDLEALARRRLAAAGVTDLGGGGRCTYADARRFFSHRRDVQHGGLDSTGRMASCIWLT